MSKRKASDEMGAKMNSSFDEQIQAQLAKRAKDSQNDVKEYDTKKMSVDKSNSGVLDKQLAKRPNDSKDTKKGAVSSPQKDTWVAVDDPNEMLKYDWEIDSWDEVSVKLYFASNSVRLGCYAGCKKVDVKEIKDGRYSIEGGGCQECYDSEVYSFTMEKMVDGDDYRLKVHSHVSCHCDGEWVECEEVDYIAHAYAGKGPPSDSEEDEA